MLAPRAATPRQRVAAPLRKRPVQTIVVPRPGPAPRGKLARGPKRSLKQALAEAHRIVVARIDSVYRSRLTCEDKLFLRVQTEVVVRNPSVELNEELVVVLPRKAPGCRKRKLPYRSREAGPLVAGARFVFMESKGVFPRVLGILPMSALPRLADKLRLPSGRRQLWPIPDSATRYCTDGKRALKSCPKAGRPAHGQDGNSVSPKPVYKVRKKTVTDAITGLMWQRSHSAPLKMRAYKGYCRRLRLAGHGDWRVPSLYELASLLDFGRKKPSVDPRAFPKTAAGWYWSATDDAGSPWVAHLTSAQCTSTHYDDPGTTGSYRVRCVRDAGGRARRATLPYYRWRRASQRLNDSLTGLQWQAKVSQKRRGWTAALRYCAGLMLDGQRGWRLPTAKEMMTLIGPDGQYARRLVLPAHKGWETTDNESGFWTSTPSREYPSVAFYAKVLGGWSQLSGSVTEKYHVICVKSSGVDPVKSAAKGLTCPAGSRRRGRARGDQYCLRGAKRQGPAQLRYPSGRLMAKGQYQAGRRAARWFFYQDYGVLWLRGHYRTGRPHGIWKAFFDNGARASHGSYRKGVPVGSWRTWHPDGKLRSTVSYVGGLPHGPVTYWTPTGQKEREGRFKNGRRHGLWSHYEKGKLTSRIRYQ